MYKRNKRSDGATNVLIGLIGIAIGIIYWILFAMMMGWW